MTNRRRGTDGRDKSRDEWWRELSALFDENVRCYLRLSSVAAAMHQDGPLSGPRRTILVSLDRSGPRTVAQMAREREQSRQRFQPLVNALIEDGLLKTVPNPAHKQSSLIALTPKGRKTVQRIHAIEREWLPRLDLQVTQAQLEDANHVLRELRAALERLLRGTEQEPPAA